MKTANTTRGRRLRLSLATTIAFGALAGGVAEACPTEPYLGAVCTTVASFCPAGYAEMVGQMEPINDNPALFSLLGCKWGGDCRTTYRIPDMRGRTPIGVGQGIGLTDIQLGQYRGQEYVTLTQEQMPAHTHVATVDAATADVTVSAMNGMGNSPTPSASDSYLQAVAENPFQANDNAKLYGSGTGTAVPLGGVDVAMGGAVTVAPTGGNPNTGQTEAVSIWNPVMAMTYCIAVEGLYPQRN